MLVAESKIKTTSIDDLIAHSVFISRLIERGFTSSNVPQMHVPHSAPMLMYKLRF